MSNVYQITNIRVVSVSVCLSVVVGAAVRWDSASMIVLRLPLPYQPMSQQVFQLITYSRWLASLIRPCPFCPPRHCRVFIIS